MTEKNESSGEPVPSNLVFACSGAADVGAIADQAARKLASEKKASMLCVASIAAEIPENLEKAAVANFIVVLDGCDSACASKILKQRGFTDFANVPLRSLGMQKGNTPVTEENIAKAATAASQALAQQNAE